MKFLLFLLIVATILVEIYGQAECPTAPAAPGDRRKDKSKLTIATLNAEWLFYDVYSAAKCPGTGCPWANQQEALDHLDAIAKVIVAMDVDVLNVVEVHSCQVLKMLNDKIGTNGRYNVYLKKGTDTATGQNVGLLTRVDPKEDLKRTDARVNYPVAGSTCGTSSGSSGVSKHQYTTFNIPGLSKPLALIGIHLLAFPDQKERCLQREAQASVIRDLASTLIKQGNYVVILGDMNDFDGTVVDPANDAPISKVLNILKTPTNSILYNETEATVNLYNALSSVADVNERWSCWYDKDNNCNTVPSSEKTLIDHVLVSPELKSSLTTKVFHNLYSPSCNSFDSDHWPIAITLKLSTEEAGDGSSEPTDDNTPTPSKFNPLYYIPVGVGALIISTVTVFAVWKFVRRNRTIESKSLLPNRN